MLVCMEALGDITARIVAKLIADRVEQEKPSAGSRKATSGGSARTGNRMDRRSEYAATMAGEDRSSHPVGENVIDYRDSAPLLAKLTAARERDSENPAAPSREAESGGSALTGNRNRVKESAAASAGEDRVPHPVQGNVIDYRDRADLLAAWGSRLNSQSRGAAPNHLKRPASKTCRASHRQHDPR